MVQVVRLVRWSGGQVVRQSGGQAVRWSGGQMVRWSDGKSGFTDTQLFMYTLLF